jgi:TRAP-type C4-dicarboxylate transport system permease large subunit
MTIDFSNPYVVNVILIAVTFFVLMGAIMWYALHQKDD